MTFDDSDLMPETKLPILFSTTNIGLVDIIGISIKLDGEVTTFGSHNTPLLPIPPNSTFNHILFAELGDIIKGDIEYEITVAFINGNPPPGDGKGVIRIAKPSISIAKTTVLNSERGRRDFAINLYNDTGVNLKDSGNKVRLSFYNDPMHSEPADGMDDIIISDNMQLDLIDEGGMSVLATYKINDDDLDDSGEIPNSGVRLFVRAEVIDQNWMPVEEKDYMYNNSSVRFDSLWKHGHPPVLVTVDEYNRNAKTASVSVRNNSMTPFVVDSGNLVARLYDANGRQIETQFVDMASEMPGESVQTKTISFDQAGVYVMVDFEGNKSVIGYIRSFNPQNEIIVQLMQGGNEMYRTIIPAGFGSGLVEQRFMFLNVNPGFYTIVVTKNVHAPFTIGRIAVVEDAAVNLERDSREGVRAITLRCGDITGSGGIGSADLAIMLSSLNYMQPTFLAGNPLADLDGDGTIGARDLAILLSEHNYMKEGVFIE
jgi:hypothetical protein